MNEILINKKEDFFKYMVEKLKNYDLGVKTDFEFNYSLKIINQYLIEYIEQLDEFRVQRGKIKKDDLDKELNNLLNYGDYLRDSEEKLDIKDFLAELYHELTEDTETNLFIDYFYLEK